MFNPFSVHLPLIGVDISGPVVRVVQLGPVHKDKRALKAMGESELSGPAAQDPFTAIKETGDAIRKAMGETLYGHFNANLAVASLPEHRCFARVIHVQAGMSDAEIGQSVPFEAESYIPLPLDQVYLDWQKIKSNDSRIAVLLVAAPKDLVEQASQIIENAGFRMAGLEVESMSIARGAIGTKSDTDCLVIDMGTNRTDLVVVEQGSLQFASSIPIAEGDFIDAAALALGLSKPDAARIVRKSGIDNTQEYPNLRQSLLKSVSMLAAEIKNIISFHDQHSPRRFQKIVMVGRGAGLLHLPEFLNTELGGVLPIEMGEPFTACRVEGVPENLRGATSARFAAAIGLAAREAYDL